MQGLCTVMSTTEAKDKVDILIEGADAKSLIDYSGFMMVA